jgi:hypothetical protein
VLCVAAGAGSVDTAVVDAEAVVVVVVVSVVDYDSVDFVVDAGSGSDVDEEAVAGSAVGAEAAGAVVVEEIAVVDGTVVAVGFE